MHQTGRFIERQPPFLQLLLLIVLVLASMFFTFFVGVLLALPFFGLDVMNMLGEAAQLESGGDVALMKYFQMVSQVGVFILPSILFALLASSYFFKYLKLDMLPSFTTVAASVILIFTILPGINWLMQINEGLSLPDALGAIEDWMRTSEADAARLTEAFLETNTLAGLMLNLFMVAVMAAVGEELLFRGVLIRVFKDWLKNTHLAVWLTAILFSMFHLQFFGFLPRFLLGLVFGYLFVWSGSLWLPILVHFLNNAAAVLVFYFYNQGSIQTPVEDFGTIESNPLFFFSILVSLGLLVFIYFDTRKSAELRSSILEK